MKGPTKFLNELLSEWTPAAPRGAWCLLSVLMFSNLLIAYSSIPDRWKLWLFLSGVLFPLFLYGTLGKTGRRDGEGRVQPFAAWSLYSILLIGLFLRFHKLTDFHLWPSGDDALQGFFAIELLRQWDWRVLYTSGQHPPLLIWILTFFFKFFHSPFFDLWFPPAFFSSLALLMGYPTAKLFFSKRISFLFCLLMAISYWPICFGRWCVQGTLVPFFELACFYLLGRFLKASDPGHKRGWGAALGALLGIGSLTFTSWFSVIFFVGSITLIDLFSKKRKDRSWFFAFLLCFILAFSPWSIAAMREGFGGYLAGVSMTGGYFSWRQQFFTMVSNLTCLLWGPVNSGVAYGPTWGGVLNPVLGGFFLVGVVEFYHRRKEPLIQVITLGFLVFLVPGLLSADHVEMFRIIPVMPLLLVIAAVGIQSFIFRVGARQGSLVLVLLLGPSLVLDIHHLWKPRLTGQFLHWNLKSVPEDDSARAYQIFKAEADMQGPGLIFTEFMLLARDHTLRVTTYPFNAADNRRFDPLQSRWAGVIVGTDYGPYLARRFPGSKWSGITLEKADDGGLAVGIIPLTDRNREVVHRWLEAHEYFHRLGVQAENMMNDRAVYRSALARLPEGYLLVEGDPFLESCYGEWLAQYHYGDNLKENVHALRRAVEKGYPSANLYYKLGSFLYIDREIDEAKRAYRAALGAGSNHTAAKEALEYLNGLKK